jgi:exodeoxyribonuclease VII large subunit
MSRFLWDDFDGEVETPKSKPLRKAVGETSEAPLSVAQLNARIAAAIEAHLAKIWVAGEISDFSQPRSGHIYFTLKDEASQIRGVVWRSTAERLPIELQDGDAVVCFGRIEVYGPRGQYQIIVEKVEPQGLGALQLALKKLHLKLEREGLFDPGRKRVLPPMPSRIGFVTSPTGAAIRDFLEIAKRRMPSLEVLVIPSKVQGEGAANEIALAIALANTLKPRLDILVVGRGGGSMEDLWCFNEEPVVRAIAASRIPTVSAVGHEIDVTLADLAADLRALTPSEAAERIVPNQFEIIDWLETSEKRLSMALQSQIDRLKERLNAIRQRPVLVRPEENIQRRTQRIDELNLRLEQGIERQMQAHRHAMATVVAKVDGLSPLKTLHRGYSICRLDADGTIVRSTNEVEPGISLRTELADGTLISTIRRIDRKAN